MTDPATQVEAVDSLSRIAPDAWDACAGEDSPFLRHAFLHSLEEAGCVAPETGWQPQHLVIRDDAGRPRSVMPCYLKGHSQGEYVFDHAWAEAWHRAGGRYYPKLLSAVPFTPVAGPRLLTRDDAPESDRAALLDALRQLAARHGVASAHITFLTEEEAALAESRDYLLRTDQQFHWFNRGYDSFDDFLAALASRKRKQIRKERRAALDDDMTVHILTGREIDESHWDAFYAFYQDTGLRKWGRPYLNRDFFSLLGARMADSIVLIMARRGGRWIAGALNLLGGDTLYGRYWGCVEDHAFLHFELCYYQAIDYAIAHGLARVEAGAQGPHKIARGYEPVPTRSAHWLPDPGFADAVRRYLEIERRDVDDAIGFLQVHTPFRRG